MYQMLSFNTCFVIPLYIFENYLNVQNRTTLAIPFVILNLNCDKTKKKL